MKYQCHTALLMIQLLRTIHHRQKLTARWTETEFQSVMATEFMLTKRSLIWLQALSTVARNVLTRKRFSADLGLSSWKETASGKFWAPQRWAHLHCTPCKPYCYATGSGVERIDTLRFLAGCRKRRLNQALSACPVS